MPPCLLRKPKRAESEIPSLPGAGPAVFSFERQYGEINGHLLREGGRRAILCCRSIYQTALWPEVCCFWASLGCLLWEDFQPCAASFSVCLKRSLSLAPFFFFQGFNHLFGLHSHSPKALSQTPSLSFTLTDQNYTLSFSNT